MPKKKKEIDNRRSIRYSVEEDSDADTIVVGKMEASLKKLKSELLKCQSERKEYLDGWQRAKADSINEKNAVAKARSGEIESVKVSAIRSMLPILDSLELALSAKTTEATDDNLWKEGMQRILSQALGILMREGVEVIHSDGKTFDPYEHEAVEMIDVTNKSADGKVIETLQRGYKYNSSAIRPAKVKIGRFIDK